jgi:hypothetical protein
MIKDISILSWFFSLFESNEEKSCCSCKHCVCKWVVFDDETNAWHSYLRTHADACALWEEIIDVVGSVPIPQAGPLLDGGCQFVWNSGDQHIDIDMLASGKMEWFYHNRRDEKIDGGDGLVCDRLVGYFELVR